MEPIIFCMPSSPSATSDNVTAMSSDMSALSMSFTYSSLWPFSRTFDSMVIMRSEMAAEAFRHCLRVNSLEEEVRHIADVHLADILLLTRNEHSHLFGSVLFGELQVVLLFLLVLRVMKWEGAYSRQGRFELAHHAGQFGLSALRRGRHVLLHRVHSAQSPVDIRKRLVNTLQKRLILFHVLLQPLTVLAGEFCPVFLKNGLHRLLILVILTLFLTDRRSPNQCRSDATHLR